MIDKTQYAKSLNLYERHLCCDDAGYYLFPPRKEGEWHGRKFYAIRSWVFDLGSGDSFIKFEFCPFCGEKLEA